MYKKTLLLLNICLFYTNIVANNTTPLCPKQPI
jgi:hypothetical protein